MVELQSKDNKKQAESKNWLVFIVEFLLLLVFAGLFFACLKLYDVYPSGVDVWGHMYKAQHTFNAIKEGCFYPLYDLNWYNGIETYRYWGPVAYYLFSIPMFITSGNIILSYQLFLPLIIVVAGIPWILMGIKTNHNVLGFVAAIMWYMFPTTVHFLIYEGNIPFLVCLMYVPYLLLILKDYLDFNKNKAAIGLVVLMTIMTATHLMITAITGVSVFLYLLIDSFFNKSNIKRKISALAYMVFGIGLMAIWIIPALTGGLAGSSDSANTAASTFVTTFGRLINPTVRFTIGGFPYYGGLSVLLLSVFGIIASNKKNKAGFIYFIIILLLVTPTAFVIISKIPFSGLFWMIRFLPIAYGMFMLSMFDWTSLKKKFSAIMVILILVDALPFYSVKIYQYNIPSNCENSLELVSDYKANRISILDESLWGPYPSYAVPMMGSQYTFGWSRSGALTKENIMLINDACKNGQFLYMFDRSIELGDEEIIIPKSMIPEYRRASLLLASEETGYELVEETTGCYVFMLSRIEPGTPYGTIAVYKGLAIGKYSHTMTTKYPVFCYGDSNYIDDYSLEELTNYEVIFLTGFMYHDKAAAERLVEAVSDSGTRVVIDASHLPEDPVNNEPYFLGVSGSVIQFTNRYPALNYNGNTMYASDFSTENVEFRTQYFQGTDNVLGYVKLDSTIIPFLGNNNDYPEIYYVGLNIIYEAMDTEDEVLYSIVDDVFGLERTELPERTIVPLTVTYDNYSITIVSPEDNVNASITYDECFSSNSNIRGFNNLLVVDSGTTNIRFVYPKLKTGIVVTVIDVLCLVAWIVIEKKLKFSDPS